jgi:hypothetical protein
VVGCEPVPKAMPGSSTTSTMPGGTGASIQLGRTKTRPTASGASPSFQRSDQSWSGSSSIAPPRPAAAASAPGRAANQATTRARPGAGCRTPGMGVPSPSRTSAPLAPSSTSAAARSSASPRATSKVTEKLPTLASWRAATARSRPVTYPVPRRRSRGGTISHGPSALHAPRLALA